MKWRRKLKRQPGASATAKHHQRREEATCDQYHQCRSPKMTDKRAKRGNESRQLAT